MEKIIRYRRNTKRGIQAGLSRKRSKSRILHTRVPVKILPNLMISEEGHKIHINRTTASKRANKIHEYKSLNNQQDHHERKKQNPGSSGSLLKLNTKEAFRESAKYKQDSPEQETLRKTRKIQRNHKRRIGTKPQQATFIYVSLARGGI